MAIFSTPGAFERAISEGISRHIEQIVDQESEAATERVRKRISDARATIAMEILRFFEVEQGRDRIIITVRDTTKEPT